MRRVPFPPPWLVGVLVVLLAGCATKPQMEDLHVPGGLTGFVFDAGATSARTVFPDRREERQYGWVTFGEEINSLMVTRYAGPASPEEIERARDAQAKRYGSPAMTYGEVESITVDRRVAWGWLETQMYKGKLASLEYKAVVSYDDVCYAVEFYAGKQDYQDVRKLKEVIGRFELGRPRTNVAGIVAGAVVALAMAVAIPRIGRRR